MENEKKKPAPDKDQQKAIDARRNSVVSAGAGSGKTTVLSQRFLSLIQNDGMSVDRILTLTFTKKATVEMSDRIYKVLKDKAPEQAALFYKSSIKTLDSYCSTIAKQGAHFYGISPDFTQDDSAVTVQITSLALPFILKNRDNPTIKKLAGTGGFENFASMFFIKPIAEHSTVTTPIDFDVCFQKQLQEVTESWKKHAAIMQNYMNQLEEGYSNFSGSTGSAKFKKYQDFFEHVEIPEMPELTPADIWNDNIAAIREFTLAASECSSLPKPGTLKGTDGWGEIIDMMREEIPFLTQIYTYAAGFHMTRDLIPLLKEFQDMVNRCKRKTGILSFKDISSMALKTLLEHPEIRQLEKQKYSAIMIDEFQDNNSAQRDMLFLLAEREDRMEKSVPDVSELCPDKLFFVGDEKQSIYRFRGADVAVFRGLSNCFKEGNLSMATNYRSHPSLIAAFNTLFGGFKFPGFCGGDNADMLPSVFYTDAYPETGHRAPDYEAVYHEVKVPESKLKEINDGNFKETYAPHVHLALFDGKAEEDEKKYLTKENAEIEWICRKIERLIHDPKNPVVPSEIAVLIPKYALQPKLEKAFLLHGVPYTTEAVTDLFSDGPVNDMTAYIRLCVYPDDLMSYAHVLRSAFVNLSVKDTLRMLKARSAFADTDPKTGEKLTDSLSDAAAERFRMAADFYGKIARSSVEEPLTDTVSRLWMESGYRFETMWNHTVEMFSKQYDLLFEIARQCDAKNLGIASFADFLTDQRQGNSRQENLDIPFEQTQGVRIMTIYKSKGLEFDHVFICGSYSGKGQVKDDTPVFSSNEYGLILRTPGTPEFSSQKNNFFFEKMRESEIKMRNAENRRLAYVAITRARKEVYITGKTDGKESYDALQKKFAFHSDGEITNVFNTLKHVFYFYMENGVPLKNPALSSDTDVPQNDGTVPAPFDAELIPCYPRYDDATRNHRKNTDKARTELVEALKNDNPYSKARLIEMDMPAPKYITPSHLHDADDETPSTATDTGSSPDTENQDKQVFSYNIDKSIPYWDISDIVLRSIPKNTPAGTEPEPKFNFADFGTVAHAFMEASVTGAEPELPEKLFAGLEDRTADIRRVKEICIEMAENFKKSSLGQEVHECIEAGRFMKAEYEFRSRTSENQIVRGIIDLVYQNPDGTFTVVDYKTNQVMEPEIYYGQLACYRQAVADMLGIEDASTVKCRLYYLRFGETVDISDRIQ